MTAYTDTASVQVRTGVTYSGADLAYVEVMIKAVTSFIDKYTNRTFVKVANKEMYYNGHGGRILEIDDFQAVSSVLEYDSNGNLVTTFDADDYELLPYNTTPKDHLRNLNGQWVGFKYKVTGDYGYSATCPDDIKMVATELVANLLSQKGGVKQESIEGYSYTLGQIITENPVIGGVLDGYKKVLI